MNSVPAIVWAFILQCMGPVRFFALRGANRDAPSSITIVFMEAVVLNNLSNRLACPRSCVTAGYAADRRAKVDKYLPGRVAENARLIFMFGPLDAADISATPVQRKLS
ncbi:MAG: hypothetical protein ABI748_05610 [Dokdonella sp.]